MHLSVQFNEIVVNQLSDRRSLDMNANNVDVISTLFSPMIYLRTVRLTTVDDSDDMMTQN